MALDLWDTCVCVRFFLTTIYRMYREVPARLVGNVPWVKSSRNNETYLRPMLNSYGDKNKRNFTERALLHIY
jgi:hypothetical protein